MRIGATDFAVLSAIILTIGVLIHVGYFALLMSARITFSCFGQSQRRFKTAYADAAPTIAVFV